MHFLHLFDARVGKRLTEEAVYSNKLPEEFWEEDDYTGELRNPWEHLEHPITVIIPSEHKSYQRCNGICYELGDNTREVSISDIQATEGNQFYDNQVDAYVEYLNADGILETFPVQHIPATKRSVEEVAEMLWDWTENEEVYDEFMDTYNHDHKLVDEVTGHLLHDAELLNIKDLKEFQEVFDPKATSQDWQAFSALCRDIKVFRDNGGGAEPEEFHLIDMNHRFQAVQRVGVPSVLVEIF